MRCLERVDLLGEGGDELVVDGLVHVDAARRRARLTFVLREEGSHNKFSACAVAHVRVRVRCVSSACACACAVVRVRVRVRYPDE